MLGIAGETDTDGEEAQAAQEQVDDSKKTAAVERLRASAGKGLLTNANTGKKIDPSDIEPDGAIKASPENPPQDEAQKKDKEDPIPMDFPTDADPVLDERLNKALNKDRITLKEFKAWGIAKGNFPADMDMSKLNETFITAVTKNWPKVVSAIKGGK